MHSMLTLYLPLGPRLEKNEHESMFGLSMGFLEALVASLQFSCHAGSNLEDNSCRAPRLSLFCESVINHSVVSNFL